MNQAVGLKVGGINVSISHIRNQQRHGIVIVDKVWIVKTQEAQAPRFSREKSIDILRHFRHRGVHLLRPKGNISSAWAAKAAQGITKTCKANPSQYVMGQSEPGESSKSAREKSTAPPKPTKVSSSNCPPSFPSNRSFAPSARQPPPFSSLRTPKPFSQFVIRVFRHDPTGAAFFHSFPRRHRWRKGRGDFSTREFEIQSPGGLPDQRRWYNLGRARFMRWGLFAEWFS